MRIRLLQAQVESAAARRAAGFLDAFLKVAEKQAAFYEIEQTAWESLNKEFPNGAPKPETANPATKPKPKQRKEIVWPSNVFGLVARTIKLMRTPEDSGVGDTIARVIGPIGGDAYKQWFLETFGKACGCTERQDQLNERFPYEKTT